MKQVKSAFLGNIKALNSVKQNHQLLIYNLFYKDRYEYYIHTYNTKRVSHIQYIYKEM